MSRRWGRLRPDPHRLVCPRCGFVVESPDRLEAARQLQAHLRDHAVLTHAEQFARGLTDWDRLVFLPSVYIPAACLEDPLP